MTVLQKHDHALGNNRMQTSLTLKLSATPFAVVIFALSMPDHLVLFLDSIRHSSHHVWEVVKAPYHQLVRSGTFQRHAEFPPNSMSGMAASK